MDDSGGTLFMTKVSKSIRASRIFLNASGRIGQRKCAYEKVDCVRNSGRRSHDGGISPRPWFLFSIGRAPSCLRSRGRSGARVCCAAARLRGAAARRACTAHPACTARRGGAAPARLRPACLCGTAGLRGAARVLRAARGRGEAAAPSPSSLAPSPSLSSLNNGSLNVDRARWTDLLPRCENNAGVLLSGKVVVSFGTP